MNDNVVVYTAIFGGYDKLLPPLEKEVPHVCYTDTFLQVEGWDICQVEQRFADSRLEARMYKLLPHRWFPDIDISIWRDGNIQLAVPVDKFVEVLGKHDIALFQHPQRDCIHQEAWAIKSFGKASPTVVREQAKQYQQAGYPAHHGLAATGVIVRRHSGSIEQLNNAWWDEVRRYTIRDQMSFNYVCWKLGMTYAIIPGNYWNNAWVTWRGHNG